MAKTGNSSRLIFVGGAPRSGTTLIQNMLDSHPLILGGPEFLHLPKVIDLRRELHFSISKGWIDIICTQEDVDNHLRSLIENLFLPLADRSQSEFYSEKSPMNILAFSGLIELFPESYFIHVVRDPRAIVSSMKKVKSRAKSKGLHTPDFTRSLSASISYVKNCFNAGFAASKKFPDKVLTIAFESLLKDPERQTKKICNFIGIDWNDSMLRPGEKEHLGELAITKNSGEIWYNAKEYYRDPDSQNMEKWQSELTLGQQIRTMMAFKDNEDLIQYGYNFSLNSLTQTHYILAKSYFLYLRLGSAIYRYFSFFVRKIPGISLVKKGLLAIVRFLG